MSAYFLAPRIAAGPAALEELGSLGAQRAALVLDPAIGSSERVRRAEESLAPASVERVAWDGSEPTLDGVGRLGERLGSIAPDWIVAVGGGRTIEAAKAAWVRYARPDLDLAGTTPLVELGLRKVARFVAVPSTSGSGCDAACSVLLRGEGGRPIELASRELVPDWDLLDPALPLGLSARLTVETGAELLAHAIEALFSEWATPFTDALARDAVAIALTELPRATKRGDDPDARSALHHAATFAGLAASNAQHGAAHALAVGLGPETDAPYGRLVGVLLPYVTEFNYPSARDRLDRSSSVLGPSAGKDRSAVADRLRSVLGPLGLPRTLADAGVPGAVTSTALARVVARARACSSTVANPRVATEAEYGRLLRCAFDGVAVMF